MNYEELLELKKKKDKERWNKKLRWAYQSYKKYRRMSHFKIFIPEWDKKIEEEQKKIMADFKLRKQYSKNYQVVELEVTGDLSEYDTLADWLDSKLTIEMNNIPEQLLVKDNQGGKPNYYDKKQSTPKQYANNRQTYNQGGSSPNAFGKPFGSPKQWSIIEKNQQRLLDEQGLTPQEINSADQLKQVVGLLFQR